jgi:alkanesulfonate monooxygenase SsuD/methylene tetrahydromethanopterin reductase-like flavin-dependent oxidoreductase (luciferase family)
VRPQQHEIGTGVIDMRYENPPTCRDAALRTHLGRTTAARHQPGIAEQVVDGFRHFGHVPVDGDHARMAREHTEAFLDVLRGEGFAEPSPRPMFPNPPGLLRIEPHSPGLRARIWWGAGSRATAEWAARHGMNLMSSTLLTEDTGVPFHQLQAEQIRLFGTPGGPPDTLGSHESR